MHECEWQALRSCMSVDRIPNSLSCLFLVSRIDNLVLHPLTSLYNQTV
jgi:hypothetical protein